jgi:hypothetical protein
VDSVTGLVLELAVLSGVGVALIAVNLPSRRRGSGEM